jgi:hypothetical protein
MPVDTLDPGLFEVGANHLCGFLISPSRLEWNRVESTDNAKGFLTGYCRIEGSIEALDKRST